MDVIVLPLHNNPVLRALAQQGMPWRVSLIGPSEGQLASNVPASLQAESTLTVASSEIGLSTQTQVIDVYLPPQLPDGSPVPARDIASIRVESGPNNAYDGRILVLIASAISDDGVTVWLKCRASGWT